MDDGEDDAEEKELPLLRLAALEHGSVVVAICSRVLEVIMITIGISSSLLIFRRLGFPFLHPSGFLSGICGFFIRYLT